MPGSALVCVFVAHSGGPAMITTVFHTQAEISRLARQTTFKDP